jgi:hypothetical protein
MATIYRSESEKTLSEFLEEIMHRNSRVVIPDLQRPYIWNPKQVILLIDSLFKKWPFGSLLCWEVKVNNDSSNYIPHRPFWEQVVKNVDSKKSKELSFSNNPSDSFLMILDGQQRLQSLLLALGGDSWGFTLADKDWKKDVDGINESIDTKHWSSGCLCLNIGKFLKEYEKCNSNIPNIDIGECLDWAITDINNGVSSRDKKQVLPKTSLTDGKFIRFSKIWNIAQPDILPESYYKNKLEQEFAEIEKDKLADFINPLTEFMANISDVKQNTKITCLTVRDFKSSGISDPKIYNNAIVNIFARLNTAGRALAPQEITLAWLKTGWKEACKGTDTTCAEELESLLHEINDDDGSEYGGMQMSMDNLVDILSLIWTIVEKNGNENSNELMLSDKDLVNGDKMKSIGEISCNHWEDIKLTIIECKEIFEEHKLIECFSRSFYAFYIIRGLRFISKVSESLNKGPIREKEIKFKNAMDSAFETFIHRWYFSTLLSDTWSQNRYPTYVARLCLLHKKILKSTDTNSSILLLSNEFDELLNVLLPSTINRIDEIRAYNRKGVILYKNILWLWNRLQKSRWDEVQKPMKRLRAQPRLEVDHAIPVKIWEDMVELKYPIANSKDSMGKENEFQINGVTYTRSSLISHINVIGNCSLLLRSHNRSKQDEQFGKFLSDIYNTAQITLLKEALLMNDVFLYPDKSNIVDIILQLNLREKKIKDELKDFFNNKTNQLED